MKITYLLAAFVAVATMFFYSVSSLMRQANSNNAGVATNAAAAADSNAETPHAIKSPQQVASTSTKNQSPLDFRGPSGQPGNGFIGPKSQPPNY